MKKIVKFSKLWLNSISSFSVLFAVTILASKITETVLNAAQKGTDP